MCNLQWCSPRLTIQANISACIQKIRPVALFASPLPTDLPTHLGNQSGDVPKEAWFSKCSGNVKKIGSGVRKKKHNLLSSPLIIRDEYIGLFNVVLCSPVDVSLEIHRNLRLILPNRRTKNDAQKNYLVVEPLIGNICSSNFIISLRIGGKIKKYLKPPPSENGSLGQKNAPAPGRGVTTTKCTGTWRSQNDCSSQTAASITHHGNCL